VQLEWAAPCAGIARFGDDLGQHNCLLPLTMTTSFYLPSLERIHTSPLKIAAWVDMMQVRVAHPLIFLQGKMMIQYLILR
jgi:hypothetical protein